MASTNRSTLIGKIHKVLRKHFTPVPHAERPVLEQLLFAACLENAPYAVAEEVYAALQTTFFDWNEVRVTTIKELSEAMAKLPDPAGSATNLRKVLQAVFETTYSFDLESVRKLNLGPAQQKLQKLDGASPFMVAFATQMALGGHSIPLDRGALESLQVAGLATAAEVASSSVAGLERAIPKNKGIEFGSLLHQLGADLVANPFSSNLHKIFLEIDPDGKERLPKRQPKKPPEEPKPEPSKTAAGRGAAAPAATPAAGKKKPGAAAVPPAPPPSAPAPAPAGKKPGSAKKPEEKKPAAEEKKPAASKKQPEPPRKKSASTRLTKRKPR